MSSGLMTHDWFMLMSLLVGLLSGTITLVLKLASGWVNNTDKDLQKLREHVMEMEKARFGCQARHETQLRELERDIQREFVSKVDFDRLESKIDVITERLQSLWDRVTAGGIK